MSCTFSLSTVVVSDVSALTASLTSHGFDEGQLMSPKDTKCRLVD